LLGSEDVVKGSSVHGIGCFVVEDVSCANEIVQSFVPVSSEPSLSSQVFGISTEHIANQVGLNFPKQPGLIADNCCLNSGNLTNYSRQWERTIFVITCSDIESSESVVGRRENSPVRCKVEESDLKCLGNGCWGLWLSEWSVGIISAVNKGKNKWLNWSRLVPEGAVFIEDFPTCGKGEVLSVDDVPECLRIIITKFTHTKAIAHPQAIDVGLISIVAHAS